MTVFDTSFDYNNLINERTNSYEDEYNHTMLFNIAYLTMINFSLFLFFIGYLLKDIIYDISLYYYNLSIKDKNEIINLSFNIKEPDYINNDKLEYNENEEIETIEDILQNNDLVNFIENSEFSLNNFKIKKEKTIEDLLDDLMNADNYNNSMCNILDDNEENEENEETTAFDFLKIYNFSSNKKLN